jgi:hypothetical protein
MAAATPQAPWTRQPDCSYDRRYRAMVLLATFASLRRGEITALRRGGYRSVVGLGWGFWLERAKGIEPS